MGDLLRPAAPRRASWRRRGATTSSSAAAPARARRSTGTRSSSTSPASASACAAHHATSSLVLHRQIAQGYSVLFEGAQATLLDIDHGTYPVRDLVLGDRRRRRHRPRRAAHAHRRRARHRQGLHHARGRRPAAFRDRRRRSRTSIRERGGEYGASTGRPRRCGWFDAVVVRYSVRVNGFDSLALTKLDVLDEPRRDPHLHRLLAARARCIDGAARRHRRCSRRCEPRVRDAAGLERRRPPACATSTALPERRAALRRAAVGAGGRRDRHRLHRPRPRRDHPAAQQRARQLVRQPALAARAATARRSTCGQEWARAAAAPDSGPTRRRASASSMPRAASSAGPRCRVAHAPPRPAPARRSRWRRR